MTVAHTYIHLATVDDVRFHLHIVQYSYQNTNKKLTIHIQNIDSL